MKDIEKEYLDIDYLLDINELIIYLLDMKTTYTLEEITKIRKEMYKLLKIFRKANND